MIKRVTVSTVVLIVIGLLGWTGYYIATKDSESVVKISNDGLPFTDEKVVRDTSSSGGFIYKSGPYPNQLFYYDVAAKKETQLTFEERRIFSASILKEVNAVLYTIANPDFGTTLKVTSLDNLEVNKTISTHALGPGTFSLDPRGKYLAFFETGALVVKDLDPELSDSVNVPEVMRLTLPPGVTNIAELAWNQDGQSVFMLNRPGGTGPESIIEFNLADMSVREVVPADSYKSHLTTAGRSLFYLSLPDLSKPDGLQIVEVSMSSGALINHPETAGATMFVIAPDSERIYFHGLENSEDPALTRNYIVGFGRSSKELILGGFPQCGRGSCIQKFYTYDTTTKTEKEVLTSVFENQTTN